MTPQLQVLLRLQSALVLRLFFGGRRLDPLGHVSQNLAGAQHAICVEAIVAEFRISFRRLLEGYGEGEVPVG